MVSAAVFLTGFTAMAAQIIYARAFLVAFSGCELSIGFIFASWLIGGAAGSIAAGLYAKRAPFRPQAFAVWQLLLAVILPAALIAIRSIRTIYGIGAGQMTGLFPMALSGILILTPVSFALGALFSVGCRHFSQARSSLPAHIPARVYVLETLGSAAGGLAASFVLVRFLGDLPSAGVLASINALSALMLACRFSNRPPLGAALKKAAGLILLALAVITFMGGWRWLDTLLVARQWPGYTLLGSRDSIYGTVSVVSRSGQSSVFDNGLHLYSVPDPVTAEESVHYALLEHPSPRSLLLIGGGPGGSLIEALKHPLEKIDYVELDPLIIGMGRDSMGPDVKGSLDDPRVRILYVDGRSQVKTTSERYDCVIVTLGDPYTMQINRYFTLEFFREIDRILNPGGVLSFGLTSSESYVPRELAVYLRGIYKTLRAAFDEVKVFPGERAVFLALKPLVGRHLTYDYRLLDTRVKERGLDTVYVRDYYLFSKLSPARIAYLEKILNDRNADPLNLDLRPVSYKHASAYWASHFRGSAVTGFLAAIRESSVWVAIAIICALMLVLALCGTSRRLPSSASAVVVALAAGGFSGMALQIVIVLSFQALYGYLYYKLGVLMTAYMIGLAAGSLTVMRILPDALKERRLFLLIQSLLAGYPAFALFLLKWLAGPHGGAVQWSYGQVIFLLLPFFAGYLGGAQFPLANRILLCDTAVDPAGAGGLTYGVDLFGACAGALVTGAILIPVIGVSGACLAVVFLNLTALVAFTIRAKPNV